MGSVVKKIAPIAIAVGAGMATGGFGFGATAAGGYAGSTSMMTTLAGKAAGGGFFSSISGALGGNLISKAGLGLQAISGIQNRKYQSQQSSLMRAAQESQNQANKVANRYRQLQARRQRVQQLRVGRIEQGKTAAGATGVAIEGTSSVMGAIGTTGTQTSANLGNLSVAEGYGNTISNLNTAAANSMTQANQAQSKADMWENADTLGAVSYTHLTLPTKA